MSAAVVAALVVGAVLVAGGDLATAAWVRSASPTAVSGATTERATPAERVAARFVDAYGAFKASRALRYLTEGAIATGSGHTTLVWGSRDGFRKEVAKTRAQHIRQTVTGCEELGESGDGVAVHCPFDFHALRSEEVGLGPYTDNSWDLVVRNGKITSAVSNWAYLTNGFSAERWQPFQAWVASTHPDDFPVMYPVGALEVTRQEIRLWDQRLREWVAEVKASAA